MDSRLRDVVSISMKFESNVSRLYTLFSDTFEEDQVFWRKLAEEEEGHALLLKGAMNAFGVSAHFPSEMLSENLDELVLLNLQLEKTIYDFGLNPPSRGAAFQAAYACEVSAGEIHFQKAMIRSDPSEFLKIFQELNRYDRDHIKRILDYSETMGIAAIDSFDPLSMPPKI